MRNLFESSYTAIGIRINQTIEGQEYRPEVAEFMNDILIQHCGSSNSHKTVSQTLFDELSLRWDQRSWFVIVYSRPDGSIADNEHYFDGSFYWVGSGNCKRAAALSFPTRQNSQKPEQFDTQTVNAINNYGCNKDNQDYASDMVRTMHDQVNPFCPNVNVGSVATAFMHDNDVFGGDWTGITYAITQSSEIDKRTKECNGRNDNTFDGNKYNPLHIFNLPPTRPYLIPETE